MKTGVHTTIKMTALGTTVEITKTSEDGSETTEKAKLKWTGRWQDFAAQTEAVSRLLCRLHGIEGKPVGKAKARSFKRRRDEHHAEA